MLWCKAVSRPVSLSLAGLLTPTGCTKKVRLNFNQPFDFNWLRECFESVRSDKASRAEKNTFWRSYVQTRSLRCCRRADLQLASGRLKLACIPKWIIKVLVRLLRTANDARWRNKQQEACASVSHIFQASPNRSFALEPLNREVVTLRCTRQRQEKSERETGKRKASYA